MEPIIAGSLQDCPGERRTRGRDSARACTIGGDPGRRRGQADGSAEARRHPRQPLISSLDRRGAGLTLIVVQTEPSAGVARDPAREARPPTPGRIVGDDRPPRRSSSPGDAPVPAELIGPRGPRRAVRDAHPPRAHRSSREHPVSCANPCRVAAGHDDQQRMRSAAIARRHELSYLAREWCRPNGQRSAELARLARRCCRRRGRRGPSALDCPMGAPAPGAEGRRPRCFLDVMDPGCTGASPRRRRRRRRRGATESRRRPPMA